jgi:hypothetical protein
MYKTGENGSGSLQKFAAFHKLELFSRKRNFSKFLQNRRIFPDFKIIILVSVSTLAQTTTLQGWLNKAKAHLPQRENKEREGS